MTETATIRVYAEDKERLKEISEATGRDTAEIVAEFIRDPDYICPECEEPFAADEIDPDSVEEYGVLTTGVGNLVKGQREVKSFQCPCCREQVPTSDVDVADGTLSTGPTTEELGVSDEKEQVEFSTEEV